MEHNKKVNNINSLTKRILLLSIIIQGSCLSGNKSFDIANDIQLKCIEDSTALKKLKEFKHYSSCFDGFTMYKHQRKGEGPLYFKIRFEGTEHKNLTIPYIPCESQPAQNQAVKKYPVLLTNCNNTIGIVYKNDTTYGAKPVSCPFIGNDLTTLRLASLFRLIEEFHIEEVSKDYLAGRFTIFYFENGTYLYYFPDGYQKITNPIIEMFIADESNCIDDCNCYSTKTHWEFSPVAPSER